MRYFKSEHRKILLRNLSPYFLLAPAVIIIFALRVVPMLLAISLSFTNTDLTKPTSESTQLVGFTNYNTVLTSTDFWQAISTTAWIVIPALLLEMVLGLGIALWLNRNFRGRSVLRGVSLLPFLLVPIVIGEFFRMFYSAQFGELNYYFKFFGIGAHAWITEVGTARWSIVFMEVWHTTPFVMILCLAALSGIPKEPIEAALVDGANYWQRFRYVILPAILPLLLAILVLRAMDVLQIFDEIYVLTGGGPGRLTSVINLYLYQFGFSQFQIGQTAAAVTIFVASLCVIAMAGFSGGRISKKFRS